MTPDPRRTGIFLVGARGSIASTVLHGLESIRSGLPPIGLVTESPQLSKVDWTPLNTLHVTGWDVAGNAHRTAEDLARAGILPRDLVDLCAGLRDRLELSMAPGLAELGDEQSVDSGAKERLALPLPEALGALRQDIRDWKKAERCRQAVVVYLATAERMTQVPAAWENADANPIELLASAPADLSRSIVYALAAISEGIPFVNFTPAPGASVPCVAEFAKSKAVPVLGNDGKTGETLLKTVLAPMFRDRALNVLAWEGYNMLGNKDGAALADPQRREAKLANKDAVVPAILDNDKMHSGVTIDYVPSLNDWKTAMDYIHFEGFLGTKMSLQFTWHGSDSALAAPLILDLVRIALHAQANGEGGPLLAAAPFFKSPLGVSDHDFHRQMELLRRWAR
jgi:myo-inositol-1-phosphate synthase